MATGTLNTEELERSLADAFFMQPLTTPNGQLEQMLRDGTKPDPHMLVGKAFNGYNIGAFAQSPVGSLFGIKKFRKHFEYDPKTQIVIGYNTRMEQTSPKEAWVAKLKGNEPIRHGFFTVLENNEEYKNAIMFDYTKDQRNGILDGGMLKDFVVALDHGLLLGKAYLTVRSWKPVSNYFILRQAE
ncbi:hypothetical protein HY501_03045 [Candidatus Woesearchaeota archaeon]|nr:hypothetical protein [Candidatus Woesearchaeota archaeon]